MTTTADAYIRTVRWSSGRRSTSSVGRQLHAAPALVAHPLTDRLREHEEVIAAGVAGDGQLGAAAPLEDVPQLGGHVVDGARALHELSGDEDRLVREEDVHVHPRAQAVVLDDRVTLIELAEERLVLQVVQLGELGHAVDGHDHARPEVARVLATNELAGVVRHQVETHRHEG
jgi:hypothetical protein